MRRGQRTGSPRRRGRRIGPRPGWSRPALRFFTHEGAHRPAARRRLPAMSTPERRMPAAFLGHGSPMNALATNRFTTAWRAFGAAAPRPRAILVVSAHWYVGFTAV